ncbi:MAG: ribose-phosphate pyrophosphokinase [Planctomycetota bacterium]
MSTLTTVRPDEPGFGDGFGHRENFVLFAGRANQPLAEKVAKYLDIELSKAVVQAFPDDEIIVKVEDDVRGKDCYILQPTCAPAGEHLLELFIWIDTLKRASAGRVTAVIPYFGYARQDRKDEGRVPITAKLVANLLERSGCDRVVSVDMHAAQVQGFFDIPVDHLTAGPVFGSWFESLGMKGDHGWAFVSPDVGNVKRAQMYADKHGGTLSIIDKRRYSGDTAEAVHIIGDVEDKTVVMVDDMISTAGTVASAMKILRAHGAGEIFMAATHAVLAGPAIERLADCDFTNLAVTDTIPLGNRADPIRDRLTVLSVAPLLGEAVRRIHENKSVSALFQAGDRAR